jgi:hypothetical protein
MQKRASNRQLLARLALAALSPLIGATAFAATPYSFDAPDQYLTRAGDFAPWAALMARQQEQRAMLDACVADAAVCPTSLRGYREIDCEDYAIAKYFVLRELGFAADDMRISIGRERPANAYHAVTVVRVDGATYFLDVDGDPHRNRPSYRFLFSLNEDSIWDHVPQRIREESKS